MLRFGDLLRRVDASNPGETQLSLDFERRGERRILDRRRCVEDDLVITVRGAIEGDRDVRRDYAAGGKRCRSLETQKEEGDDRCPDEVGMPG